MLILNLGAGKQSPILHDQLKKQPRFIINLDTAYYESALRPEFVEKAFTAWERRSSVICYCKEDAFTFMERTKLIFDRVCIYRLLEHISMDKVLYFIYLISMITKKDSEVDVIVSTNIVTGDITISKAGLAPDFDGRVVISSII